MKRALIRSTLFNLTFYGWTAISCILFLPGLLLPRKYFLGIVRTWIAGCTFLEKNILNLHYEIRGRQFLPATGAYIAAAKHQSPYETIKLRILFRDPAIVLKKELLSIPFWGWFLKKSDVIAIDRSTPDRAYASFEQGALRMKDQGRPIVIFPQGTRVWPDETPDDKPYRSGVARVQASTNLPIIPMALNTGIFWPRSGWLKSPGTVVFEFLEPIQPGREKQDVMDDLRIRIEEASNRLAQEALTRPAPKNRSLLYLALICILVFAGYTALWFKVADQIKISYLQFMQDIGGNQRIYATPAITGYPGRIHVYINEDTIETADGRIKIQNVNLKGWPIPLLPVQFESGNAEIQATKWQAPLVLDKTSGSFTYFNQDLKIHKAEIYKNDFTGKLSGTINLRAEPVPDFDLLAELDNYQDFLLELANLGIIKSKDVFLTTAALGLFTKDGVAKLPVTQRDQYLYVGPLRVASLPVLYRQAPGNPPVPAQ